MAEGPSTLRTRPRLWQFFVLVFCWTWSFWIAAAVLRISVQTTAGQSLLRLGLLGPLLGGVGFAYLMRDREYWRDYWGRIVDPRRIPVRCYPAIVLLVPGLMVLAVLLDIASGGNHTLEEIGQRVSPFAAAPLSVFPFALGVFVNGPFPEELGWRGYALGQLRDRWDATVSSLGLGVIWALWHLPLFFMKDMLHARRGVWSAWFWLFLLSVVASAFIYTWIFDDTERSTLAAIAFHFVANLTYSLANVSDRTNLFMTLFLVVIAAVLATSWRRRPAQTAS